MRNGRKVLTPLVFLFLSSFFIQMVMGTIGLTVPIYATYMGATPVLVGVIGATGGLVYSFMPLIFGILSDKFKRKSFISISIFLYSLSCLFYVFAKNAFMLVPIKVLEMVSIAVFWPSIEALLVDMGRVDPEGNLKKFNLSWGSAMILGPAVGGLLISVWNVEAPFLFSFLISLTLAILDLMIVKDSLREKMKQDNKSSETGVNVGNERLIIMAILSVLLFSSIAGIIINIFPAYATRLGIPAYEIGLIMFVNGIFRLIAFFEAYRIKVKVGELGTFLMGSLILASASALAASGSTTITFSISFLILGFGAGISYAASISIILRKWAHGKGYAAGLFESLIGLGYFLGSLTGGYLSEFFSNAPYIFSFFFSLIIFSLQIYLMKEKRNGV